MAKSILNTIHKKITELSKQHPHLFLDFLADHIGDASFQWFLQLLPEGKSANIAFAELVLRLYMIVMHRKKGWENILQKILKVNASYIEGGGYNNLSPEKLKELFEEDAVPSLAGSGVTPEMMIMYLYYKRRFRDPLLPFLFEEYKRYSSKIETSDKYIKDPENFRIPEKIKGTLFELELKSCLKEDSPEFPDNDEYFVQLAEKHGLEYIPEKKKMLVPRGFAFFFINKMEDLFSYLKTVEVMYRVLLKSLHDLNAQAEKLWKMHRKLTGIIEEKARLERDLRLLRKKLSRYEMREEELKKMLETEKETDKDAHIRTLQKELNYAYSRIESLEKRVEELEEAKEINREIKEDVEIAEAPLEEKASYSLEEGMLVVISGGRWNSKSREETERFFEEHGCVVEFVPAEDTIRKQDLIANADLVVFDTSRHAHKYYYKVKQINGNIIFINKSTVDEIKRVL